MATTTAPRKPASPTTVGKRPALRAHAEAARAVEQPSDPSSTEDMQIEAVRLIAREEGYRAGLVDGAERERARLNTDEEIGDRIERLMALEVRPRALRALDHAVSWLIYAIGISGIVAGLVIIWRLSKWI